MGGPTFFLELQNKMGGGSKLVLIGVENSLIINDFTAHYQPLGRFSLKVVMSVLRFLSCTFLSLKPRFLVDWRLLVWEVVGGGSLAVAVGVIDW